MERIDWEGLREVVWELGGLEGTAYRMDMDMANGISMVLGGVFCCSLKRRYQLHVLHLVLSACLTPVSSQMATAFETLARACETSSSQKGQVYISIHLFTLLDFNDNFLETRH